MSDFPSTNFWRIPDSYRQVCTNKDWKSYLLANGTSIIAAGHSYTWKSKPLGGGIREVWLERKHP